MRWATRAGIHIDRAASAWLIARFVDPNAAFVYVDDIDDVPPDATTFDMVGGDLTHQGGDVTFETILRRYELTDPALWRIGEIVHEADVRDERFDAPEAPGLDVVVRALGLERTDEEVRLLTAELLDGLHAWFGKTL